jgi:hypothetical protein
MLREGNSAPHRYRTTVLVLHKASSLCRGGNGQHLENNGSGACLAII